MEPLFPNDPRSVGEFQLRARLGSGGMGRVYLGYSPAGRAVAVKVVRPGLAGDPEFSRRFTREVDAARAVSGMYTAPVVAAGPDDDPPWLATAFVPGPSLAELVERHGPLPEPAAWRLAAGLAEALRAVHACGLVHRDLKPANVLLALDGPHLIDFGISRALDGVSLTQTGMVVGTPGYMSPEQADGKKAGPPSDVFSFGALLAFAATGKAPFGHGSVAAILYRLVSGEPDLDGVQPGLRDVITGCMAKDPGQRPDLPSLSGMIVKHGPALSSGPATRAFWPSEVAGFIRASQPDLGQVDDRTLAAASARAGAAAGGTLPLAEPAPAAVAAPSAKPSPAGKGAPAGTTGNRGPAGKGRPAGPAAYSPAMPGYGGPGRGAGTVPAPGYGRRPPMYPGQYAPYGPYPYNGHAQYGPPRPVPMAAAARLMRLGAALSLVNGIVILSSIARIKASALAQHPFLPIGTERAAAGGAAGAAVVGSVVSIAAWLWLAGAARRGRRWVRPTGTVLFGVYTLGVLAALKNSGITSTKDLGIAVWVIGLLAVIAMWARRSPR
jgi:hypothetical protein